MAQDEKYQRSRRHENRMNPNPSRMILILLKTGFWLAPLTVHQSK